MSGPARRVVKGRPPGTPAASGPSGTRQPPSPEAAWWAVRLHAASLGVAVLLVFLLFAAPAFFGYDAMGWAVPAALVGAGLLVVSQGLPLLVLVARAPEAPARGARGESSDDDGPPGAGRRGVP